MAYRPRVLSVSAVQRYVRCPANYRQVYVEKLVTPTNAPLLFGKAFHSALEAEHRGENSERAMIAAWNIREAELAASGQILHPGKAHALALLDEYKRRGLGGKMGEPERKFVLPFPSSEIPVPLMGYIDLPIPERRRFREFKSTSTKKWNEAYVAMEHQLHVYGWAYQRIYKHRPECAEYVIFGTTMPTVEVIEGTPSPDGFRLFEIAAAGTWRGVLAGEFDGCGEKDCETCTPPEPKLATGPTLDWGEETTTTAPGRPRGE